MAVDSWVVASTVFGRSGDMDWLATLRSGKAVLNRLTQLYSVGLYNGRIVYILQSQLGDLASTATSSFLLVQ